MTLEEFLVISFNNEYGIDLSGDPNAMERVRNAAARAEYELGKSAETEVNLPFITANKNGPLHLNVTVNRNWRNTDINKKIHLERHNKLEAADMADAESAISRRKTPIRHEKRSWGPMKKDTGVFYKYFWVMLIVLLFALIAYFLSSRN